MITSPLGYIAVLMLLAAALYAAERVTKWKVWEYLPAIVLLYFGVMVLSTFGLWEKNDATTQAYKALKSALLPAMIFLLLLQADIRLVLKLGKKLLLAFVLASVSIALGFGVMFALLHAYFPPEAAKAFGALAGSWMGGTGNMVAVQSALNLPDSALGYTLLIDSVDYAIWVMLLLALVPFAPRFNRFVRADTHALDEAAARIGGRTSLAIRDDVAFFGLLALSLSAAAVSYALAGYLPVNDFFGKTAWVVVIATLLGIIGAFTPLGRIPQSGALGQILLFMLVALIASRASFAELTEAPLYITAGFIVLGVHGALMVLFAKLFRLDLFTVAVASLANIGGVASAPILASAYSRALIPVGVLMALLGYVVGTFGGLAVARGLMVIGM